MSTFAIVQARMNSNRLPGKVLRKLANGRTVLENIYLRLLAVNIIGQTIDRVVVATSFNPLDNAIEDVCNQIGINCFRGSEDDVLGRFCECALASGAKDGDRIIRVCGDSPFVNPFMVYGLIHAPLRNGYQALAFNKHSIPAGWDCEIMTFEKLKWAYENSKNREHVTTDLRDNLQDAFDYGTDFNFKDAKFDLDTESDWRRIYEMSKYL